ncbi:cobalt-precorrin-5B (C(1))-methyltransferase CbiD [Chitinophaga sancti]|uniref:cobalt-precorrin-5B (C(1))-methyltransferase CbiD n=1 Tax=Chitinophaga sancti TaxID=1004 RepID=UPI002A766342|nr:cobalt-precorrin-5B (C(1))-methyltransferase CbiD [Chitinophaga sancti]WPQ61065.1 cobalt-precorrin-5B (C(1))-methyltransferase CbiD [Chitinophaga sancti]
MSLRTGYTTGACATACTKAALIALLTQAPVEEIEITLPLGQKVLFKVTCSFNNLSATCTTIKDGGDDPDATHGATIGSRVSLNTGDDIVFLRGEGVGVVTLPGLAIGVGEPAINPVPRKMMRDAVNFIRHQYQLTQGVDIQVFVVNGEEIAKKTLNARIGILGGISILGTTGIVKPFSASAYIASITQGIDVSIANGCDTVVINSGGRSENILRKRFALLPEFAFVQYGNWIGETLDKIKNDSPAESENGYYAGQGLQTGTGRAGHT